MTTGINADAQISIDR